MGTAEMLGDNISDFRHQTRAALAALLTGDMGAIAPNAQFDICAPIDQVTGPQNILASLYAPLGAAFTGLHRRDEILIGGTNRRQVGGTWVASFTHYVGRFRAPLWGIQPHDRLAFLRSGEFYRLDEDGRIVEAKIIMDLPDLLRQCGRNPFPNQLGVETLFPGPATHDGVCPADRVNAKTSLNIVEGMLGDLKEYDPETKTSAGQTGADGYWHSDFFWYGPGGIGSTYQWGGFVDHHRESFLDAFPDRVGGNHYCRIGDGNFAAVSGWPSMTMTHQGPYLGQPGDGRALTLRVMDFYRCDGRQICENWVMLDYVDLFRQMGRDVIAEAATIKGVFDQ